MASRVRLDGYGAPLPALTDARQQSLQTSEINQQQRRLILELLEEQYQVLLCRGRFAKVTLTFHVRDGNVQPNVDVTVSMRRQKEKP